MKHKLFSISKFFIILAFLMIAGTLPSAAQNNPAPPPPISPTSIPPAQSKVDQQTHTPPMPGEVPVLPEVEKENARHAMEAVINKYNAYWGPRYQLSIERVKVEGEWAYGVAQWQSEFKMLEEPIYVLAHRSPDGTWQALMPDTNGLYIQWLDAIPESLIPGREKSQLRKQAAKTNPCRMPQTVATLLPPTIAQGEHENISTEQQFYCNPSAYEDSFKLDGIILSLCIPFSPDSLDSAPETSIVQSAAAVKHSPNQIFSIYAIPY